MRSHYFELASLDPVMHALHKVGVLVSKNIRLQSPWNDTRTDVQNNGFATPPPPPFLLIYYGMEAR